MGRTTECDLLELRDWAFISRPHPNLSVIVHSEWLGRGRVSSPPGVAVQEVASVS